MCEKSKALVELVNILEDEQLDEVKEFLLEYAERKLRGIRRQHYDEKLQRANTQDSDSVLNLNAPEITSDSVPSCNMEKVYHLSPPTNLKPIVLDPSESNFDTIIAANAQNLALVDSNNKSTIVDMIENKTPQDLAKLKEELLGEKMSEMEPVAAYVIAVEEDDGIIKNNTVCVQSCVTAPSFTLCVGSLFSDFEFTKILANRTSSEIKPYVYESGEVVNLTVFEIDDRVLFKTVGSVFKSRLEGMVPFKVLYEEHSEPLKEIREKNQIHGIVTVFIEDSDGVIDFPSLGFMAISQSKYSLAWKQGTFYSILPRDEPIKLLRILFRNI